MTLLAKKKPFGFHAAFPFPTVLQLNWPDCSPLGLNCRTLLNNARGASRGSWFTPHVHSTKPRPPPQYYGAEHTLSWWVTCGSAGSWRGSNQCNDTAGVFSSSLCIHGCAASDDPELCWCTQPVNELSQFPCTAAVFAYMILFQTNVEDALCFSGPC